ncbi:MAG: hypothetical protein ACXU9D_03450 [Xanthobacteraceae bacterium]
MRRFLIAAVTCSLLGCGRALAQVGMITAAPAPLGVTSPLGLGPGAPVGATGIPLGATELATPGVSASVAGTAALGSMTASTACSGIGASAQSSTSIPGTSGMASSTAITAPGSVTAGVQVPTPLFDSAGMSGNASGTCASGSAIASSSPTASASSPTSLGSTTIGRVGIPLGSTELSPGGLSPLPDITLQSQPSASTTGISTSPCVLNGASPTTATSTSSGGC